MKILNDSPLNNSIIYQYSKNPTIYGTFVKNNSANHTNKISFGSEGNFPICAKKVDDTLYRGSRPSKYDFSKLKDLGISTIIDLSVEEQDIDEEEYAKNYGMNYVSMPVDGFTNIPKDDQLKMFFNIIKQAKEQGEKVFVHCLYGEDRTGLMVNFYKLFYKLPVQDTVDTNFARHKLNGFLQRTKYKL